ncbi:MAG TPA: hypothetical protein DCY13_05920 [Verrucomicrobiales bacterium]|nr:hypothetical protein [Verrucomicrobiales bacterium]
MAREPDKQPPGKNGLLPNLQWLCVFMVCFAAFLFATKPAMNSAQMIFRVVLLVAGVVGWFLLLSRPGRRG